VKTWQAEGAVVAAILAMTVVLSGGHLREWIGALAVQLTFHHGAISDRMAEQQALKSDVSCWRWSQRLFVGKEALWLAYFGLSQTWSALVGVLLFLIYPLWRRAWRHHYPLTRN
jgi:hypothetical protein